MKAYFSRYIFKPSLIPTLAFLLILPCLVALGFWQLDRAEEKRLILKGLAHAQNHTPLTLDQAISQLDTDAYYGITVEGQFIPDELILLMHTSEQGIPGLDVLGTFVTTYQGQPAYLLIDQGFIAEPALKACEPSLSCAFMKGAGIKHPGQNAGQTQVIRGIIQRPQPRRFILGETIPEPLRRPLRVQRTDLKAISAHTGRQYLPLIVLAETDLGDGLIRRWQYNLMPPEKHIGYAVQWFGLAIALVVIYIVVNIRRRP